MTYDHNRGKTLGAPDFSIGDRIGQWTVIGEKQYVRFPSTTTAAYLVRCECGTERVLTKSGLRSGKSLSCGCHRGNRISQNRTLHGHSRTDERGGKERLYNVWRTMKARCTNPTVKSYSRYGGRGIQVCPEWTASYVAFRAWAIENGYDVTLSRVQQSIDRIDGNGNYEPSNCRWTTTERQANNLSTNRILEAFGQQKTLADWSRDQRCVVNLRTLNSRVQRSWPIEEALTTPRYVHIHPSKPYERRRV